MTELELIIDLHKKSKRQGPGSYAETIKAFDLIDLPKGSNLKILDIGCGSGGQTLTLAQKTTGQITAVDIFSDFLVELNEKVEELGLLEKVITLQKSMGDLQFNKKEFDIIWSEGAIYNIGFENGIKKWRDFLKTGGYLAVSEVTWLTNSRPKEIEDFWSKEYPEIGLASTKIKILEDNGFILTGYFNLAEESWTKNYYNPLEERFQPFLDRHKYSKLAKKVVREHKEEIEMYQKNKEYYSYGFYIARKFA